MIARFAADAELGSSAASAAGSPDQLHPVRCRRSRTERNRVSKPDPRHIYSSFAHHISQCRPHGTYERPAHLRLLPSRGLADEVEPRVRAAFRRDRPIVQPRPVASTRTHTVQFIMPNNSMS